VNAPIAASSQTTGTQTTAKQATGKQPTARQAGWLRPHTEDLPPLAAAPARGRVVGVLAMQGAFAEHAVAVRRLGAEAREVRQVKHLDGVDSLIIPGGESTTISKLLISTGLFEPIAARIAAGMPVFGTCAGMIMLASSVADGRPDQQTFGALNISVQRNGYGRQVDSFETDLTIDGIEGAPVHAAFIRAPKVLAVGSGVDVLAQHDGVPVVVGADGGRLLATSFHPELTPELRVHQLFLSVLPQER
jgi:pyridoxal 5'-phosphate synthase pdxT subunit